MNKLNIAGILRTYSEKCAKAANDKQIHEFIKELEAELKEAMKNDPN